MEHLSLFDMALKCVPLTPATQGFSRTRHNSPSQILRGHMRAAFSTVLHAILDAVLTPDVESRRNDSVTSSPSMQTLYIWLNMLSVTDIIVAIYLMLWL